jgi:hypothetical protein
MKKNIFLIGLLSLASIQKTDAFLKEVILFSIGDILCISGGAPMISANLSSTQRAEISETISQIFKISGKLKMSKEMKILYQYTPFTLGSGLFLSFIGRAAFIAKSHGFLGKMASIIFCLGMLPVNFGLVSLCYGLHLKIYSENPSWGHKVLDNIQSIRTPNEKY